MKNDINILGDDFKTQVDEYLIEEANLREVENKYNEAKKTMENHNRVRIKIMKDIRKNKIEEINEELKNAKKELENLKKEIEKIFSKYCEIHNHKYILINRKLLRSTGRHSFKEGFEHEMKSVYKCKVCGNEETEFHTGYGYNVPFVDFKREIPYEIYDDKSLSSSGKNIRDIEKEIEELEIYIDYLMSLKTRICELFGHDVERISSGLSETFKCNCCGKEMGYQTYITAYHKSKYKDIIPYYYRDSKEIPTTIINRPKQMTEKHFNLPSYEDYHKKMVLKRKKEDKN